MRAIDEKHLQCLHAIHHFIQEHKRSPMIKDVAVMLGVTNSLAYRQLLTLRKKGLVGWKYRQPASLYITRRGYKILVGNGDG